MTGRRKPAGRRRPARGRFGNGVTVRRDAATFVRRARAALVAGRCDHADYLVAMIDASTRWRAQVPPRTIALLQARAARCHDRRGW